MVGGVLAALHPRSPSCWGAVAAACALGLELREVGRALAGDGVAEFEEGWRKVGAAEVVVCVDWLVNTCLKTPVSMDKNPQHRRNEINVQNRHLNTVKHLF